MGSVLCVCKICGSDLQPCFEGKALNRYFFEMLICLRCGFLQIANPHWLSEAYSDAISSSDTGLVARNLLLADRLSPLLFYLYGSDGRYVDFAGGTGLLTRLMRDAGFDFYWHDPYCKNVHARGFEFDIENGPYKVVTAFEVLEHVLNPIEFVSEAIRQTHADVFIFSTELFEGMPPKSEDWWYYSFETGQHVSFYQNRTLHFIADKLGLNYSSFGQLHLFYKMKFTGLFATYFKSRLTQKIARYKAGRCLKSKTMSDCLMLREQLCCLSSDKKRSN